MRNETGVENSNLDLLLNKIEIDNENHDFRFITEYELIFSVLKRIFGNHESIRDIKEVLSKLKENENDCKAFTKIRAEMLASIGNDDLMEDVIRNWSMNKF